MLHRLVVARGQWGTEMAAAIKSNRDPHGDEIILYLDWEGHKNSKVLTQQRTKHTQRSTFKSGDLSIRWMESISISTLWYYTMVIKDFPIGKN